MGGSVKVISFKQIFRTEQVKEWYQMLKRLVNLNKEILSFKPLQVTLVLVQLWLQLLEDTNVLSLYLKKCQPKNPMFSKDLVQLLSELQLKQLLMRQNHTSQSLAIQKNKVIFFWINIKIHQIQLVSQLLMKILIFKSELRVDKF